jgi:DNA-binding GntR family transcriptional regulator
MVAAPQPSFDSLSTPTYARLRERLRQDILAGAWLPGEHRTLAGLAATHGVSQSPVREALLALEGEGLVDLRQHRGAVVPILDAAMLGDLYDVRGALQELLARRAAERATEGHLARLAAHQSAFAASVAAGDETTARDHDGAFHATIHEAAANPQAVRLLEARAAFVSAARRQLGYGPARLRRSVAEHERLLAALRRRDPAAAAAAAFDHVMESKAAALERLAAGGTGGS